MNFVIAENQYVLGNSEIKTFGLHLNSLRCYYNKRIMTTGFEGRSNKINSFIHQV